MYKLTMGEQEVSINFNREEKDAVIHTTNKYVMKKLDKYCEEFKGIYKCISESKLQDGTLIGKTYTCPKKLIGIRKPNKNSKIIKNDE